MDRKALTLKGLRMNILDIWPAQWFLLGAGDFPNGEFNAMTVAWGTFGTMWRKPVVQVMVRPQRYTYEFMENYPTFSVCAFPEEFHKALNYLGTHSGREGEKITKAGLHPMPAREIKAPVFQEADLVLECKKIYSDDIHASRFIDPEIDKNYPQHDYHRLYIGEIVHIECTDRYK